MAHAPSEVTVRVADADAVVEAMRAARETIARLEAENAALRAALPDPAALDAVADDIAVATARERPPSASLLRGQTVLRGAATRIRALDGTALTGERVDAGDAPRVWTPEPPTDPEPYHVRWLLVDGEAAPAPYQWWESQDGVPSWWEGLNGYADARPGKCPIVLYGPPVTPPPGWRDAVDVARGALACPGVEIEPGVWSGCNADATGATACPTCGPARRAALAAGERAP